MALSIKIPDSAYHEQKINLDGTSYILVLKFNTSDQAWYIDIKDINRISIVDGIKVMPNQNLTGRFPYMNLLRTGNLWCFRARQDFSDVGRDNFGTEKTYELVWLTSEEELELGLDDTIQI